MAHIGNYFMLYCCLRIISKTENNMVTPVTHNSELNMVAAKGS
jgi:hypothetical protein